MSARDDILSAIRAARPAAVPLPDARALAARRGPEDGSLQVAFARSAEAAGARVVTCARADVGRIVEELHGEARAAGELAVCQGVIGVAENGAVWVPVSRMTERAAFFLSAQVVLVLDAQALVSDLHAAYERINVAAESFGAFVAGPSKTADIEQAMVIGAHAAKSLTVLLVT